MDVLSNEALSLRRRYNGLIGVESKVLVRDRASLALVYTPGVAESCNVIAKDPAASYEYTGRGNTVAIVTDGSNVHNVIDAGPEAALPVMEAKSVIFKTFGGIDALPICVRADTTDTLVKAVMALEPTFGAICLEDIAAPRCFVVLEQLEQSLEIPVLHSHQHSAGILVLAALINAMPIVGKKLEEARVVVSGAGAAGVGVVRTLLEAGVRNVVVCDRAGIIHRQRQERTTPMKEVLASQTNGEGRRGGLAEALRGADVFVGVSAGHLVDAEAIAAMAPQPVVLALAVPEPEIDPEEARQAGARVVATGRADYPNQMDIALVFPGLFRGLLDTRARRLTSGMLLAAARALAGLVSDDERGRGMIVPRLFDFRVAPAIAAAVAAAAVEAGEAQVRVEPTEVAERMRVFTYEGRLPVPPRQKGQLSQKEEALDLRRRYHGVLQVKAKLPIKDEHLLELLYLPPATTEVVKAVKSGADSVYDLTAKANLVAVVSDGSAVLGLGNIGPLGAMPVMEGKCVLFNTFGGVEAFPICLATQDAAEIVDIVERIAPVFGGINLEDISAPRCFEIERRLKEETDIPIFHDDQHGAAVVTLAGLVNALKLVGKSLAKVKIVVNGAGAAGIATTKLLLSAGAKNVIVCDTHGAIYQGREQGMNWAKAEIAKVTNPAGERGGLAAVMKGADVFIGVSAPRTVTQDMVRSMAKDPIVFACANPTPEILPAEALAAGAKVVATGRSDFDNQINNSLAFPGIFRGALDERASDINEAMKAAAANAIAGLVSERELRPDYIIPIGTDLRVPPAVARAVAQAAIDSGVARRPMDPGLVAERTMNFLYEGFLGDFVR